ncbi:MAG: PAS and helix-turn-helix domain-containing protein [Roseibium sp.]|uniref:PAS and helix-turn-helix domain-containing protein n=1 Tax=Roseibium sp. TaxID=1936156 RepID=UPI002628C2FD|nr:PAS and helix-turn-helix domain-containing protein [Roseibium sp.]MCV0425429.1 PAS and helix-turn-helix domain-containing protein [Roseibium sp.]
MEDLDQLAFDNAPMGLALTENRVIQTCNETFAWMFGYRKEELIGQSFRLLYGSDQEFHQIRDIGLEPLRHSLPYTDERLMRRSDGSMIWCRFRARTLTPETPLARTVLTFALIDNTTSGPQLTPREREVLLYLSKGLTSKEIARELDLSPRTIEDVRARLLKKFQVKNVAVLLTRLSGHQIGKTQQLRP